MEITVYKGKRTWMWETEDAAAGMGGFDDKWQAYDSARRYHPNAVIKVEGVGVFNGGSPITTQDVGSEVSRISREATPAS